MRFHHLFSTLALALLCATAASAVPDTFLYVGDLDEDGAPANGAYAVTFQMFDDATAGAVVFAETVASLDVTDGVLVHELGASPSDPLDDAELAAGDLYLSVVVNGTVLEPRVPIRAVPFSARSANAETLGGLPLAAFQDGSALADGAIQPRHLSALTKIYKNDLSCTDAGALSLTTSDFCLASIEGCPSGQQHPCGTVPIANCTASAAGSRRCSNVELGSLVFTP